MRLWRVRSGWWFGVSGVQTPPVQVAADREEIRKARWFLYKGLGFSVVGLGGSLYILATTDQLAALRIMAAAASSMCIYTIITVLTALTALRRLASRECGPADRLEGGSS